MPLPNPSVDANKRGAVANDDPYDTLTAITKSDTNDIWGTLYDAGTSRPCRSLLVGTAGTADLIDASGVLRSAVPLQLGYNRLRVRQIKNTGTAANIWALE